MEGYILSDVCGLRSLQKGLRNHHRESQLRISIPPPPHHRCIDIAVWLLMMLCFQAPLDTKQNSKALSFITRSCCTEISSSAEEGWDCAVDHSPIRHDLPMTSSQAPLPEPLWSANETSHDGTNCQHTCSPPFLRSVHLCPRNNLSLRYERKLVLFLMCFLIRTKSASGFCNSISRTQFVPR